MKKTPILYSSHPCRLVLAALTLLAIVMHTAPANAQTHDDYVVTPPATPITFYPTLNDTLPCDNVAFSIVTMPVHGNVVSCYGAGNNEGSDNNSGELPGGGGEGNGSSTPTIPCLVYTPESTLGDLDEPPITYIGLDSMQVSVCCGDVCDTS